ncbi:uncharacterized protein LODBEIA_P18120 [Lodderomyces beijingensis]|uniref:Signal recognition particle receptor subunit beta n=1 Tax=Lodderomyces beijingensis TaxID=1775926 RepID=A0ABP0ZHE9_9ASCO
MDKVLIILLSLLIGFTIILVQFFLQSGGLKSIKISSNSPHYKPTFLICGPNNAGKTALFFKLTEGESQAGELPTGTTTTVSSIEPNFGTVVLPIATPQIGKKFQLVDYPGHLKYWNLFRKLIKQDITLSQILGVVVVLDSSSAHWAKDSVQIEKLSKFLYNLLAITERKQNGIDFLFAVNKSDLFDSLPVHRIRSILESEINKLIKNEINSSAKTSGIDALGDGGDDGDDDGEGNGAGDGAGGGGGVSRESLREFWLGVIGSSDEDAVFTFDKLEGNMDFASGSVTKNKIGPWEGWFDEKVVNP